MHPARGVTSKAQGGPSGATPGHNTPAQYSLPFVQSLARPLNAACCDLLRDQLRDRGIALNPARDGEALFCAQQG